MSKKFSIFGKNLAKFGFCSDPKRLKLAKIVDNLISYLSWLAINLLVQNVIVVVTNKFR